MKPSGNKTLNHEPNGHPALRKPRSGGDILPQVHRDNIPHKPIPKAFDNATTTSYRL